MADLYNRFYESERYRDVRQRLDFGDLEELEELIRLDQSGDKLDRSQKDLYDRFTDYLNFFEYAVYLEQTGQLTDEDLKALFEYYLDNITHVELVSGYVKRPETGFERLRSRVK